MKVCRFKIGDCVIIKKLAFPYPEAINVPCFVKKIKPWPNREGFIIETNVENASGDTGWFMRHKEGNVIKLLEKIDATQGENTNID